MKFSSLIIFLLCFISCNGFKYKDEENSKKQKNLKPNVESIPICNFETYVIYKDSLPIYSKPNGKIIQYFRFEDDPNYDFGGGFLFKNSDNGWLQIGKNELNPELESYWIQSKYIQIGTTNYNNQKIPLFETPNTNAKKTGFLKKESYLNVIDCNNNWALVKKDNLKGWIQPEFICTNSTTNCN